MTSPTLRRFQAKLGTALQRSAGRKQRPGTTPEVGVGLCRFRPVSAAASESLRLEFDALSERLNKVVREGDSLVQVDDTTFGFVLQNIDGRDHLRLAGAKLERELKLPLQVLDQELPVRFNAGLVLGRIDQSPARLLSMAAHALSIATRDGCSLCFESPREKPPQSRAALEAELAGAMARGEFAPYFQPKVSAAYQTFVGAEALTRWHSKDRGVVSPQEFMGTLETSDLIEEFTYRLLRSTLSHTRHWPASLTVSVNVPAGMLHDGTLILAVRDALALFSVAPERLILEITESGLIEEVGASVEQLEQLRRLGVGISIDDFGTGYSSLAYLRDLPATEVKLDRSFLRGVEKLPRARALVAGIIQLAHALDLKVVAEGIERRGTATQLKTLGCDLLQGYLYGKPAPAPEFNRWLNEQLGAA